VRGKALGEALGEARGSGLARPADLNEIEPLCGLDELELFVPNATTPAAASAATIPIASSVAAETAPPVAVPAVAPLSQVYRPDDCQDESDRRGQAR
jgi:hypothetical protein